MHKDKMLCYKNGNYLYLIIRDFQEVGAYIYKIKIGNKIVNQEDYLQNDIEMCKNFAFEEWHISKQEWQKCDNYDMKILNTLGIIDT